MIVPDDRRNAEHPLRHGALGLFAQRPLDVRRLRAGDHSLSAEPDVICQLRYHVGIADVHLPTHTAFKIASISFQPASSSRSREDTRSASNGSNG